MFDARDKDWVSLNDRETHIPVPKNGGLREFPEDKRTTKEVMKDFYENGFQ